MNAVGAAGERDIDAIVYDEPATVRSGKLSGFPCEIEKISWRQRLGSQLEHPRAAAQKRTQYIARCSAFGLFRIENRIKRREMNSRRNRRHEILRDGFF